MYSQAIALKPDYAEAHNNLGIVFQELGRIDEAESMYSQAIALKPDYAEAHRHLSLIKKFVTKDDQYLRMLELSQDKNITDETLCHINFALAKACDDLENFEKAFNYYNEGNKLRKKLLNYNIKEDVDLFKQIKSNNTLIKEQSLNIEDDYTKIIPVFIVGMPRSGTSLVEQIISSHSRVTGAGELSYVFQLGKPLATGLSIINEETLLHFRNEYLSKLRRVADSNVIVTDKMPLNFRFIGLLTSVFPEAKIIHVKRNPAAVCWANFIQYFVKNIGYCCSIEDILTYYKLYEDLMRFWSKSLSDRIYNLDYELLTTNQENETRHLIDHIGLDWDERCLSPQNNKRRVITASNIQIRKKIYQGSSLKWKKYHPFLKDKFDVLLSKN